MSNLDDETINSLSGKTVRHTKYGEEIIAYVKNRKYIEVYFLMIQLAK